MAKKRKAIDLSDEVIKRLQKLAEAEGRKLKNYMENVLIAKSDKKNSNVN